MAITIRADKGSALTYTELDNNFLSYFYSASISANQEFLNLFYTGSSGLSVAQSSVQIPLNPYTGSNPPVAGSATQIQFNNAGSFGADPDFIWDSTKNAVGISQVVLQTEDKLAVRNGDIRVESTDALKNAKFRLTINRTGIDFRNSIELNKTSGVFSIINSHTTPTTDAYSAGMQFVVKRYATTPMFALSGTGKTVFRNATLDYGDNNFSGSVVIDGASGATTDLSRLTQLNSSATRIGFTNASVIGSVGNARGLVVDGPNEGHVIVGIQSNPANGEAASNSFAIISGPPTASNPSASYTKIVAMFKANGSVGIGTHTVASGYRLQVNGKITGSRADFSSNLSAGGNISGSLGLYVSGSSTLSGSVTLNTVADASSATNYNFLVRETSGNVAKQVNAAPVPLGGIIMWSGAVQTLPSGWALCNGQTSNGTVTPDLRNKFILGSNNTSGTPTSTLEGGGAASTGGDVNHNHGGSAGNTSLATNQLPAHGHGYKDGYYIEINDPGTGHGGTIDGADLVVSGGTRYKGSGDSDGDNKYIYYRNMITYNTGSGAVHTHTISAANHIPNYYSLAYIMYTG